jgi:hypothetical protein
VDPNRAGGRHERLVTRPPLYPKRATRKKYRGTSTFSHLHSTRADDINHRMPDSSLVRAGRSHHFQKPRVPIQKRTQSVFVCDLPEPVPFPSPRRASRHFFRQRGKFKISVPLTAKWLTRSTRPIFCEHRHVSRFTIRADDRMRCSRKYSPVGHSGRVCAGLRPALKRACVPMALDPEEIAALLLLAALAIAWN